MPKTVILGTARTPFGKLGGALSSLDATDLGGHAISAALDRAEVAPEQVQHVVMGQVLQAGQGQVPSRQAQIKGGIPKEVSSETVNKVCASGIRSAGMIDSGDPRGRPGGRRRRRHGVDVEGAVHAQGRALRLPHGRRQDARRDDPRRADEPVQRQAHGPRGQRGRRGARDDAPGPRQVRAALTRARDRGHRRRPPARGDRVGDDQRRRRATPSSRSTRRRAATPRSRACRSSSRSSSRTAPTPPATRRASTTAPARWCSPATSGRKANGRTPLATIVAQAAVADDFPYLARTPANATKAALEKAGLTVDDIDLFEINEAFASVALNSMRMLGVDESKVNVNGGAIALGHPIGASGARIVGALVHELRRRGGGHGRRRDLLVAVARATR